MLFRNYYFMVPRFIALLHLIASPIIMTEKKRKGYQELNQLKHLSTKV